MDAIPYPVVLILYAVVWIWTERMMRKERDAEIRKVVAEELVKRGM